MWEILISTAAMVSNLPLAPSPRKETRVICRSVRLTLVLLVEVFRSDKARKAYGRAEDLGKPTLITSLEM